MLVPLATGVHICALRMSSLLDGEGDGVSVQIRAMVGSDKAISLRCGVCGIRG